MLPTERLQRRDHPPHEPLVLVEMVKGAQRIAAASRHALRIGLTPGLALADARARIPDVNALDHDKSADDALIARMIADANRWSPTVAPDPPHGIVIDITGCDHLFGGEGTMRRTVLKRFKGAGFTVRGSIAGTAQAARAVARFGETGIVAPGRDARAVGALPIAALELEDETQVALRRAGFEQIDELAALPAAPLAARFGAGLVSRLDRLLGRMDGKITASRALPAIMVKRRFAEPIGHADQITATLHDLAMEASAALESRGEGGRTFIATFFRSDGAVRTLTVLASRPSRDPVAIARLFDERIEALADPIDPGFGFDCIALDVFASDPLAPLQPTLDGRAVADDVLAALDDRLIARFGPSRVLRFVAADTHDPVRASRLEPLLAMPAGASPWLVPEPEEPQSRPLHLLDPPQPVEAIAQVPDGPPLRFTWRRMTHRIIHAEGPERIADEWWRRDPNVQRDYYRIEDHEGRRFWLFREGQYGEEPAPRWYLHGIFP